MSEQYNTRLSKNNFDLLRLVFAFTVLLVHTSQLTDFQELRFISEYLSGTMAVKAFFVISGFLIFMSYERSSSIVSYAKKRIRRIYPAYFVVVTLSAISLLAVSSNSMSEYFSFAWLKYLLANLSFLNFLQPTLPGVFESNKIVAVNGALWSLKIEAMFYLVVPILVLLFQRFSRLPIIATVYCLSIAYVAILSAMAQESDSSIYLVLARQLPGQLSYFMGGAFLYYFMSLFEKKVVYFVAAGVLGMAVNNYISIPFLEPISLAILVVFCGFFMYLGNFGKYGDFSYGIYILHFPIIQIFLHYHLFSENPWYFLISVILITTCGAIAMWHLIEKRFLLRKSHYISASVANGET